MKPFTTFIFTTVILSFMKCGDCSAKVSHPEKNKTILYIDNKSNRDLGILVNPKLIDPVLRKNLPLKYRSQADNIKDAVVVKMTIPACALGKVTCAKEHIGTANQFSVIGETNPITPTGKCSNLEFGKIYYLWFTNDNLGTTCVSQELEEPLTVTPKPCLESIPYKSKRLHITTPDELPDRPSQLSPLFFPWRE
jgi:hypothetical protein